MRQGALDSSRQNNLILCLYQLGRSNCLLILFLSPDSYLINRFVSVGSPMLVRAYPVYVMNVSSI